MDKATRTQPVYRKKARRGSLLGRLMLLLVVLLLCLAAAALMVAAIQLPRMAEQDFGPASPALPLPQKVLYSLRVLRNSGDLLVAANPGGAERSFQVGLGEPVGSIAIRLEDEQLIRSAQAFRTYLVYAGLDTGIQAGKYRLSPAMTPVEIARALQDSAPKEVEFNILPGWRAEEIAAALPTSGIQVTPEAFLRMVGTPVTAVLPDALPGDLASIATLEGFLMPGSYTVPRDISAQALVKLFYDRSMEQLTPDIRQGFASQGLSLLDGVVLASIVQREAVVEAEQPTIASVFANRLAVGMKLDSDPTVQYALGYDEGRKTWWKNPLTTQDLQVNSRYNTYIYPGLPPGPIANPGISALRAAAFPADTPYYYFRALCDGSGRHAFAETYEEHLNNACQ